MSRKIWKYVMDRPERVVGAVSQVLRMPLGAQVLHVAPDPQTGHPALWCAVDPHAVLEAVVIRAVPTGGEIPDWCEHLGTTIHGTRVWHILSDRKRDG